MPGESDCKLKLPHILQVMATSTESRKRHSALHLAIAALEKSCNVDSDAMVVTSAVSLVLRCLQKEYFNIQNIHIAAASFEIVTAYLQLLTIMFRRACATIAVQTFESIGTDLITVLVTLLGDKVGRKVCHTKIFELMDQLSAMSKISLAKTNQKELLVNVMQRVIRGEFLPHCSPCIGMQLLSSWVDDPQSKAFILHQPGLLGDILGTAATASVARDENTMRYTATFLLQITREAQRKPELVVKKRFLETLLLLLNFHHQQGNDADLGICHTSTEALGQLATEAVCRVAISKHKRGSILNALVQGIEVPGLSEATNRSLLRLIGYDTVFYILKKVPDIIDKLVQCGQLKCTSEAPPLAAQCLKRISSFVALRNKTNSDLFDALTCLAGAENSKVRFWAAKGLCEQVKSSTGRFFVARDESVLQILVGLAKSDSKVAIRSFATDALVLLALDTVNAKRLAGNSDVLEIFVRNAQHVHRRSSSGRSSIQALLSLASHQTADKKRVAKTLNLVATLSEYGVSQDMDHHLKSAALHCVIVLAPHM